MKVNEILNEKERVDELVPLIPLGTAAWTAGKAAAAAIAKHGIGTLVKGGIKKGAVADKVRQWTSKAPPDSSVPDSMKTDNATTQGPTGGPIPGPKKQPVVEPKNKVHKSANVGPMSKLQRATT
ncbi:MAG: hypothetical protein QF443_04110 [Dehalococcoidia bacterium]|nr:hypothetical protein [Dehalococcoidia bacterium]